MEMAAMKEKIHFSPEDRQFIDRAIGFCQRMGERAVLMLVGSRAASFADKWSDLDCVSLAISVTFPMKTGGLMNEAGNSSSIEVIMKPTGRFMMKATCERGWRRGQMR